MSAVGKSRRLNASERRQVYGPRLLHSSQILSHWENPLVALLGAVKRVRPHRALLLPILGATPTMGHSTLWASKYELSDFSCTHGELTGDQNIRRGFVLSLALGFDHNSLDFPESFR